MAAAWARLDAATNFHWPFPAHCGDPQPAPGPALIAVRTFMTCSHSKGVLHSRSQDPL
jgi:hypothetical protein